jgi:DNA-directed RNA polymerase subunit K/omega
MDDGNSSDEEVFTTSNQSTLEDINNFKGNYEVEKKNYQTRPLLTKYERTLILSERTQQLANGSMSFLKNPENYNSTYEIAVEELRQKKIPFLLKRPFREGYELWKVSEMRIN